MHALVVQIVAKDSNVQVVAEAINCFAALAKGLRREYASTARGLTSVLLDKYKEKNAAVGRAVPEALEAMHRYCWTLLDVHDDFIGTHRAVVGRATARQAGPLLHARLQSQDPAAPRTVMLQCRARVMGRDALAGALGVVRCAPQTSLCKRHASAHCSECHA